MNIIKTTSLEKLLIDFSTELAVDYALVSNIIEDNPLTVETVVYVDHGKIAKNFSYPVERAPCNYVFRQGYLCIRDDVVSYFPEDPDLVKIKARSYAGVMIKDDQNRSYGHVAILHTEPLKNEPRIIAALKQLISDIRSL